MVWLGSGRDGHEAISASVLDEDDSSHLGKQGIVTADAHVLPGFESRAPLSNEDTPSSYRLTREGFHPQTASHAVPTVPRTAHTLFVCHGVLLVVV
jgi:hypothetical protein